MKLDRIRIIKFFIATSFLFLLSHPVQLSARTVFDVPMRVQEAESSMIESLPGLSARIDQSKWLLRAGKTGESVKVLRQLVSSNPKLITPRLITAKALVANGERKSALEMLAEGWKLLELKKYENLEKIKENYIKQVEVLGNIFLKEEGFKSFQTGVSEIEEKNWKKAKEDLENALSLEPFHINTLSYLSKVLVLMGKLTEAKKHFATLYKFIPWDIENLKQLSSLELDTGDYKNSADHSKIVLNFRPLDPQVRMVRARSLFQLSEYQEAILILRETLQHHPEHVDSLFFLGRFYFESKTSDWLARKYLSLYLKREQRLRKNVASAVPGFKLEAEDLLRQVDTRLEL